MILQVTCAEEGKIQVSDGMNTCYLNIGNEKITEDGLCSQINNSANRDELVNSIFVFEDFIFDFEWDYQNKSLMISLVTDSFHFLHPGILHTRINRSKDLSTVLGGIERESLKRAALKKKLQINLFEDIEMDELIGITSTGGIAISNELDQINRVSGDVMKSELIGHHSLGHFSSLNIPKVGLIDKCIMMDNWLKFPSIKSNEVLTCGDIFENFEEFVTKCIF